MNNVLQPEYCEFHVLCLLNCCLPTLGPCFSCAPLDPEWKPLCFVDVAGMLSRLFTQLVRPHHFPPHSVSRDRSNLPEVNSLMSRTTNRTFYEVAVEPSASALLQAVSQATSSADTSRNDVHDNVRHEGATDRQPLPNYVAFNFNFKPDSTHDCRKGALFQPSLNRAQTTDWQLELESNEAENDAGSSTTVSVSDAARKKPAHVFTGPQTAAKAYDLVLVWDAAARMYRLDQLAATFSLKYERSKTTLSDQSQQVWASSSARPAKRATNEGSVSRTAATSTTTNSTQNSRHSVIAPNRGSSRLSEVDDGSSEARTASSSGKLGGLKLRSRASASTLPVRRSSRRSLAVEMEEFEDQPDTSAEPPVSDTISRSRRSSTLQTSQQRIPTESSKKANADEVSDTDPAVALRRRRRRSSQTQAEDTSNSPRGQSPSADTGALAAAAEGGEEPDAMEGEDDDLARALERELEREIEIEMHDISENDEQVPPAQMQAPPKTDRALSPVSRLKHSERQNRISTPNAHTPDSDDVATVRPSLSLRHLKRPASPQMHEPAPNPTASIGLGLQQTGVGITPTASPHLETASPRPAFSPKEDSIADSSKMSDGFKEVARNEDDEDDDLQDFAAELDLSLAEAPDASPAAALPAVAEQRKSSRASTAAQSAAEYRGGRTGARQVRKAYGLGGPRQEEEELEDSD